MQPEPDTESLTRRLVGTTIDGKYRVERLLGEGGMGAVFVVHHLGLRRDLALKVLRPELTSHAEIAARFDREAHSAARLDHPNCLQVTDFGTTEDGLRYIAMQLLSGQELTELLHEAVAPERAVELCLQILRGLEHAHGQGIAHRDLKPENVFVTTDHEGAELLKLVDFGIAKLLEDGSGADPAAAKLTRVGMVFGTPTYMSPEQAAGGDVDHRADLYSVGIILYQMLAGRVPFDSDDLIKLLRLQITAPPPPLPETVPLALRAIVARLLEKDRDARFADASAVCEALIAARASLGRPAASSAALPIPSPTPPRVDTSAIAMPMGSGPSSVAGAPRLATLTPQMLGSVGPSRRPSWPTAAVAVGVGLLLLGLLGLLLRDDDAGDGDAGNGDLAADHRGVAAEQEQEQKASAWNALVPPSLLPVAGPPALDAEALREIDEALLGHRLDAAEVKLTAMEDEHPEHPHLRWRRGRLQDARKQYAEALATYGQVAEQQPGLLDDPQFRSELSVLLHRPALREAAVDVAIEQLGHEGHEMLIERLADLDSPLPLATRGRAAAAVAEHEPCAALVDARRQIAQDLLQAKDAEQPCSVAAEALDRIADDPHEVYLQPAHDAKLPRQCKDERTELQRVRKLLVEAHGPAKKRSGGGGGRCRGLKGVFRSGC
ncbi:MAG: serine/threonine-protein kinase [Nannocystaceae bacterium]